MVVAILVEFGMIKVRWDSIVVPATTTLGSLTMGAIGLVTSILAYKKQRSWRSVLAILFSLISLPFALFMGWILAMVGLAGHPV